ncbi:MAG: hypothetical protein J1E16_02915 [Muribaculaceae bacterium]|nr:hypothetical protein [Muribaculaceae bacterium]
MTNIGKTVIQPTPIILAMILILANLQVWPIGKKIVKEYPMGVLQDVMPWQINEKNGMIFIASNDGLVQFDGFSAEIFPFQNRRQARSFTIDEEENKIYIGGISEFGLFEPSALKSLEYVCLSDSIGDDRYIGNIWGVYKVDNNLLAQGDNAVAVYDFVSGKHKIISTEHKLDVSSLIDGVLWLGTDDGLKLLLSKSIVNAPNSDELKGKRIRKILPYKEGLLIITSDAIWTYNNQKLSYHIEFEPIFNDLKEVFSADIKGDKLALGSVSHGVGILDLTSGDYDIYEEKDGLPSNTVVCLYFDNRGDLWAGLQFGVAKINLQNPVETIDNNAYPIGSGYVMLQRGGELFLGTNRGLFRTSFNPNEQKIGKELERIGDLGSQVWGLSLIDGEVMVSMDQGLFKVDKHDNIKQIEGVSGVWDVRKMFGTLDRAYVGTYSGIHLLRKRNKEWEYEAHVGGYLSSVYNFAQESPTVIWNDNAELGIDRIVIDTLDNVVKEIKTFKETKDGVPLTADVSISRIDDKVYFSTKRGIYIYDPKSGEIIKEKEFTKLLGNPGAVKRLKKVNGGLFALTENELLDADPAGILDMKRISLSPSVTRPMHEGDLFFPIGSDFLGYPTKKGFMLFDLNIDSDSLWNENSPFVRINQLIVTNQGDSIVFKGNFGDFKTEPKLRYDENSVKILFGRIDDLENGVLYSTRVNNEPWSQPSQILSKELTNLREGKYRFEVKALTPGGKEAEDYLVFRVSPPWWRSPWMIILYSLFAIFIILIMLRMLQLNVTKRQTKLLAEKDLEMARQKERHQMESAEKDRQIETLEREQIERELKQKSQEYANVMMSLGHKNDALQTVKRELQNILAMVPRGHTETRKAISALQDKVVVDIKSDDVLKRVEEEFDIVHDNFIKKLRERYPDLSNNEVMLCAYLKMNLSTKEIAPLLNISQRGVETLRYRLRKKLNLEREASLSAFITNLK